MTYSLDSLTVWLVLLLVQIVAAIPWTILLFTDPATRAKAASGGGVGALVRWLALAQYGLPGVAGLLTIAMAALFFTQRDYLEPMGGVYGAILQLQLTVDAFILVFGLLLWLWPKGGAVALAAFREGIRQPMFWLLAVLAFVFLTIAPFIPYFTFGEDYIMVQELGYDTLMLAAVLFGTLAASMFIAEEIEGRTAVTLMSKPISRRQFLLGKFVGITLAALLMYALLGCYFAGVLDYKYWWDKSDPVPPPLWVSQWVRGSGFSVTTADLLQGLGRWVNHSLELVPGLVLSFCQVAVLVAVAVALATRVPMVVNMSVILAVYLAAHLAPVLVGIGQQMQAESGGSTVAQLVSFTAQLFETLLPGLGFFRVHPALTGDTPLLSWAYFAYIGSVLLYAAMYTAIVLLLGLIFFEDRDLA